MAVLDVDLSFPHSPITSLQKRIEKGIEQLYYVKLFLTDPAYADGEVWPRWHERGFHVAIFSPPPGTAEGDRVRVRMRAPSPTPQVSVTGTNVDALHDLESMLQSIDTARPGLVGAGSDAWATELREGDLAASIVRPLTEAAGRAGLDADAIDDFLAMLQRGFDALTDDSITAIHISLS